MTLSQKTQEMNSILHNVVQFDRQFNSEWNALRIELDSQAISARIIFDLILFHTYTHTYISQCTRNAY